MLEKTIEFIRTNNLNIYDIAIMTDSGIEHIYCQPCNACNASYSVTKLFIVTMMGILYDNGLVGLNDKITDIISGELNFRYDPIWNQVTIRHALTHKMGIEQGVIDIDRDDTSQYKYENYLEYIFLYPPTQAPGFWGKGGMNGQMTMFDREKKISVAWHGYEPDQKDTMLISWFESLPVSK